MDYQTILYQKANSIARITLNRPEKLNALSPQLMGEVVDAIRDAGDDDEINVIVIKGTGRCWSAGYDLSPAGFAGGMEERRKQYGEVIEPSIRKDTEGEMWITNTWNAVWNSAKPIIAQVHGYCLAGGTDFALNCDIIICAEDSVFGYPPVRTMGTAPTHMWTYLVGPQWAKYTLFTGNPIDGKTAERIGLVLKAVPAEELEEEVNNLAETMANISIDLLSVQKRIVNLSLDIMGRTLIQQLCCEGAVRAHSEPVARAWYKTMLDKGLKAALDERDTKFGDYRTSKEVIAAREARAKEAKGKA